MRDIAALLDELLRRPPPRGELDHLDAWWLRHCTHASEGPTAHRAVLGGFAADRLAYAFASGYSEALRALLQLELGVEADARPRALCATEQGGGHPRAIACALQLDDRGGGRLRGDKSFVTLGSFARELLIVASAGEHSSGRKRLKVVRVPADSPGLKVVPLPPLSFVPELPHARVELREVEVEAAQVMPGDGYLALLKPFRTIEDTHVFLALLGWLVAQARAHAWADEVLEGGLSLIASLVPLASTHEPLSPGVHRTLAACLQRAQEYVARIESSPDWARMPEQTRARWARDKRLLGVASKVRARRLETARGARRH